MRAKHYILSFVCLLLSTSVCAEYAASDLKKLFTDKSQRALIDARRSGKVGDGVEVKSNQVKVSGYMTRSDGKSVVWVNNKNTLNNSKIDDVRIHNSSIGKDKKVTVTVEGKTARLKPGEVWIKETGKTVESYK